MSANSSQLRCLMQNLHKRQYLLGDEKKSGNYLIFLGV